ncbi:MAG: MFS transporter, partial [Clostridiales bacterium]|nr:MFS transporter [Clostridiales bacterium]
MIHKNMPSKKFWLSLVIFGLIGQVAWVVENMYLNVFIYKMFQASPKDISLMVGASAVVATVTTMLIGPWSDKVGKRKVFITLGYLFWGLSILAFALLRQERIAMWAPAGVSVAGVGIALTIILDCLMTFFGSTANDAAFNAWLTDATPQALRGKVEGINAMMPLLAILVVFGGFMFFDLSLPESWTMIFFIIGGVVFVLGVLGFWLIHDVP